ncbi:MAG: DUF4405 domain-containing protein [Chloroflexi bacterium]|nr:DUF4405 domain-containing protein [Chloroflexota bacterium]
MPKKTNLSLQTRANWLVDASVLVSGLLAALTGIYFLFFPSGGYRGGRNPFYGMTILFDRHVWQNWHAETGMVMIVVAIIHLVIHWRWIKTMTKRAMNALFAQACPLSNGAKLNLAVDLVVAISFSLTAISGLYFFFLPARPMFVFDRVTWDLIHTWAFVVLLAGVLAHLAIHWRWMTNVTERIFRFPRARQSQSITIAAPSE